MTFFKGKQGGGGCTTYIPNYIYIDLESVLISYCRCSLLAEALMDLSIYTQLRYLTQVSEAGELEQRCPVPGVTWEPQTLITGCSYLVMTFFNWHFKWGMIHKKPHNNHNTCRRLWWKLFRHHPGVWHHWRLLHTDRDHDPGQGLACHQCGQVSRLLRVVSVSED